MTVLKFVERVGLADFECNVYKGDIGSMLAAQMKMTVVKYEAAKF